MNCLYCCQFCIVITVPGTIESVAAPSGLPIWAPEEVEAAAAGEVALPLAFIGTLFTWAIALVEPIRIASQNVRQARISLISIRAWDCEMRGGLPRFRPFIAGGCGLKIPVPPASIRGRGSRCDGESGRSAR